MTDHIKTALELALEKIASEPSAPVDLSAETRRTEGRKIAAAFLRGEQQDLKKVLDKQPKEARALIEEGIRETFLRNLVLPRTPFALNDCRRALEGLAVMRGNNNHILQLCAQAQQLCEEYLAQITQAADRVAQDLQPQARMVEQQAQAQAGMAVKISPEQLPDFQKHFQAQLSQLNDYFNGMLEEIKQQLAASP
jgi:hypothetical protein